MSAAARTLHIVTLLGTTVLALWGILLSLVSTEPLSFSLGRGVPAAALIACNAIYCSRVLKRHYHWSSLLAYVLSVPTLTGVLAFWVRPLSKGFPPSSASESLALGGVALLSFSIAVCIVVTSWRASSGRLSPAPNSSIERTSSSGLCPPPAAAHVKR